MIVISTSDALAELLPEVCYSLDPDMPHDDELPATVRRYVKDLILHAFYHALRDDLRQHADWLARIRQDQFLSAVSHRRWVDIEVVDTDGTLVLIFEEHENDHRIHR